MTRTTDPPARRNYAAQAAFRALCTGSGDAQKDFRRWRDLYPNVTPEQFESSDRRDKDAVQRDRKAEALDLIFGVARRPKSCKESGHDPKECTRPECQPVRDGGFVGRGRVINGKPYRRLCVGFEKVPELAHLRFDPSVQFDAEKLTLVEQGAKKQYGLGTCFFVEWGDAGKGNHINVLTTQGRGLVVPDDELPGWVGYISKKPPFTETLAVPYIVARRTTGGRALPSRRFELGCSPRTRPVPLAAIVDVLGAVPTRGKRFVKGKAPRQEKRIAADSREQIEDAQLPLLQGATPETLVIIKQLRAAWAAEAYDGVAFAHGPAKMADLGRTLAYYFGRSKLFPGETYDLEQYAIALGFGVTDCAPKPVVDKPFVTRRHISPALAAPGKAPERRPS